MAVYRLTLCYTDAAKMIKPYYGNFDIDCN